MSVYSRNLTRGSHRLRGSVDFTEAMLMVGLVIGSKLLGLW